MQRKPSYYARKSFAAVLAGAAGLVVGIQIDTDHASVQRNPESYFVMQAYASDAFVPFVTGPQPTVPDAASRIDLARECDAGIDTDCIYL